MSYEIREPVYGYVTFDDDDKKIIDTPQVQRLRRVLQLAVAYVAYPGATHTRFEHSVGAMYLASLIGENLKNNGLTDDDRKKIKLAGLLHDLGHGPFSHSFEYAMTKKLKINHEDVTEILITQTEIADIINSLGFEPKEIADIIKGNKPLLSDFIAGQVDVDKIDFLLRDSLHAGVDYGRFDWQRLIRSFYVRENRGLIGTNSLYSLESFLIARFQMFRAVYYHKTVRAADLMLERAIYDLWDYLGLDSFNANKYLNLDDYSALSLLNQGAKDKPNSLGARLIKGIISRDLVKVAYEKPIMGGKESMIKYTQALQEEIANAANTDQNEIFVDTPYLPVIPLSQSLKSEVDVWDEKNGNVVPLSTLSKISSSLSGYYEALRIYTFKENREKVNEAARRVLENESELHF
ncbi:MAG: HD domain-containing protein [Thermoprotei archaeon]